MGFLIMGAVGYIVKLSKSTVFLTKFTFTDDETVHIPVNNVLVG